MTTTTQRGEDAATTGRSGDLEKTPKAENAGGPRRLNAGGRELVERFRPLAGQMALVWGWNRGPEATEELEGVALLALAEAATTYDATRGVKFSTFARHRIKGALLTHLRKEARHAAEALGDDLSSAAAPAERAVEDADLVDAWLAKLPPRHAAVCRELYVKGRSAEEVAGSTGYALSHVYRLAKESRRVGEAPVAPPEGKPLRKAGKFLAMLLAFLLAGASAWAGDKGPTPDDDQPDSVAIQALVDAAAARAGDVGRSTVRLAPGLYLLDRPVIVNGRGITLDHADATFKGFGSYVGPQFVFGNPCVAGDVDAGFRPPIGNDGSVGGKRGVRTQGKASLLWHGDTAQLGGEDARYGSRFPTYWSGMRRFTLDVRLIEPPGTQWPAWANLLTLADRSMGAMPLSYSTGWTRKDLCVTLATNEDGAYRFHFASDGSGDYRLLVLGDMDAGSLLFNLNGAFVRPSSIEAPTGKSWRPGLTLRRHDGIAPLVLGAISGPPGGGGTVTDVTLGGLYFAAGLRYKDDGAGKLVPADPDDVNFKVNDQLRYFLPFGRATYTTFAALPLDDGPGPFVTTNVGWGNGVAYWVRNDRLGAAYDCRVAGGTYLGVVMPPLVLGQALGATLERVVVNGGFRGIDSLPTGPTWPTTIRDATLSGIDCPLYLHRAIARIDNLTLRATGRDGVRCLGGSTTIEQAFVSGFLARANETIFRVDGLDSTELALRGVCVDNEAAGNPTRAIVLFEQAGQSPGSRLTIDGLGLASTAPGSSILELVGHGVDANYQAGSVDVRRLTCWDRWGVLARVTGPSSFAGPLDGSLLDSATVAGNAAGLAVAVPARAQGVMVGPPP